MSKDLLQAHARRVCTCRAWLSLHPLFSAYPLLGAYLLTTYTYKRICLLTRVYGTIFLRSDAATTIFFLLHVFVWLLFVRVVFIFLETHKQQRRLEKVRTSDTVMTVRCCQ